MAGYFAAFFLRAAQLALIRLATASFSLASSDGASSPAWMSQGSLKASVGAVEGADRGADGASTPGAGVLAVEVPCRPSPRTPAGRTPGLDAWLDGRWLEDVTLAAYLAELHDLGRAPASASTAVPGACFRARLAGEPSPAGERTGRGVESDPVARERGRLDAVIAGLLFMAGMRRSEVSALRWADVADAADGDGVLVTVRRSKTNQEGETTDVRFVKGGVARAIRTLRAAATPGPTDRVAPLSPEEQYDALKAKLQAVGFIGQGSVQTRRIACGSPTCRCHHDPDARHGPYHYWTRKARGKTVGLKLTEDELGLYRESPPIPSWATSTCRRARRRPTTTAGSGWATTCSPRAWWRWTSRPGSACGTSRWCTTASGTTTIPPARTSSTSWSTGGP